MQASLRASIVFALPVLGGLIAACGSNNPQKTGTAPTITVQPQDQTVAAPNMATFTVTATGTPAPTYQWNLGTATITGATLDSYTTGATTSSMSGTSYTVTVTNSFGSVTSAPATLTVTSTSQAGTAPTITVQPQDQTVTAPNTATFTVTATGTPAPTYQWNLAAAPIAGATFATYTTPATTSSMNGASYTVTVTNSAGSVTSAPAILTVTTSASVTPGPALSWTGSSGGFNYTQGSYLEGFQFMANSAIKITQLGAYDSNDNSLPGGTETFAPAPVGVYDLTTHTLLGSTTVAGTDPVTGAFHFATLTTPIALNTTDTYAVVWASQTNYYIASPTLTQSDVNPAINYIGYVGHGSDGLTTTSTLVEPDFLTTYLNYDLGPNFIFATN